MPNNKCYVCGKTAYPLESYSAADNTFHKLCFRCMTPSILLYFILFIFFLFTFFDFIGKGCNVTLNVGSFKAFEGSVYCSKCVPKPSATQVADDFKVKTALSM